MDEKKQNGHTKKRRRPEFRIFVRVDFYWTQNVENVEKKHSRSSENFGFALANPASL